jgi:hypothetical protein
MTRKLRYLRCLPGTTLSVLLLALGACGAGVPDSVGGEAQAAPIATETTPGTTSVDYLVLGEAENEAAAEALASYLEQHGIEILLRKGEDIGIQRGDSMYVLSPKVSSDGLDRIVVAKFLGVEDRYHHGPEVDALVKKLNEDLNVGTFSLDNDGDLMFQSHVTFVDRVDYAEIEAFLEFVDTSIAMMVLTNPTALIYLA